MMMGCLGAVPQATNNTDDADASSKAGRLKLTD
jgi:hypothetical protein